MTRKISAALLLALFMFSLISVPAFGTEKKAEPKEQKVILDRQAVNFMTIEEAQEFEKLVADRSDYAALSAPAEPESYVPGASASGAMDDASGLFNGIFGGLTSYDYQHNGTCHRQIDQAFCPDAGQSYVHVTWMKLHETTDINDPNRNVHYNVYDWLTASWLLNIDPVHGGMALIAVGERGGYTHVECNAAGNAIVYHHSAVEGAPNYGQIAQFSICGFGIFVTDQMANAPGEENIWPSGANAVDPGDGNEYYHVTAQDSNTGGADQVYWRFDKNADAWAGPVIWDSVSSLGHMTLARESRVVLAQAKPREYGVGQNQYDNDLAYYECNDNGDAWLTTGFPTWETGGAWNCTDYTDTDDTRQYIDISGGFDFDGKLHFIFVNPGYDDAAGTISVGPTELLHWNETTAGGNSPAVPSPGADAGFNSTNFHTIAQALWGTGAIEGNEGGSGAWNRYICKMSLAFGDGSTDCDGDPNLNYLYSTYTQFGSRNPVDKADASLAGNQNANIWLSISNDNGGSWAAQKCITTEDGSVGGTPTRNADCDPNAAPYDTCRSEHWSSNAHTVNDTLHVWYIGDLDAGGIPQSEGGWTMNDVMYLPIIGGGDPNPLCPTIAPVLGLVLTADIGCEYYADNDEPVNTEELTVSNIGNAQLDYSIAINYIGPSGWLAINGQQSIPTQNIVKSGPEHNYVITMDGSQLAKGLYQLQLRITNNDPEYDVLGYAELPVDFFVADSFFCRESEAVNTGCGIRMSVSNVESWGSEAAAENWGMYYEPPDDPENPFNPVYDACLLIKNKTLGSDYVYRNIFTNQGTYNPGFRALESPKRYYNAATNDTVVTANQVTVDSTIGISVRYMFPQDPDSCEFVRIKFKIYPYVNQDPNLVVGVAADLDVDPDDNADLGGIVNRYNLVYGHGTDTTTTANDRASNEYAAGITALTCEPVLRRVIQSNALYVYPDGGFGDEYIYAQMDSIGDRIWFNDDPEQDPIVLTEDLHQIISINEIYLDGDPLEHGPSSWYVYQIAMVTSINALVGQDMNTYHTSPPEAGIATGHYEQYVQDLLATCAKAWKKGFGWCGDFAIPDSHGDPNTGPLHVDADDFLPFMASGTHEEGIEGACCGCIFKIFEIDPPLVTGTITVQNNGDCTGGLVFANIDAGETDPENFRIVISVEDPCYAQGNGQIEYLTIYVNVKGGCFCGNPFGDVNDDGGVNPVDVVYMVNKAYKNLDALVEPAGWNCPRPIGDVNNDGGVNPVDVVYYVNKAYKNLDAFINPCD